MKRPPIAAGARTISLQGIGPHNTQIEYVDLSELLYRVQGQQPPPSYISVTNGTEDLSEVTRMDGRHFLRYPSARSYIRLHVIGEFAGLTPMHLQPVRVVVTNVVNGLRIRTAVFDQADLMRVQRENEITASLLRKRISLPQGKSA